MVKQIKTQVSISLTPSEKDALTALAASHDLTASAFIAAIATGRLVVVSPEVQGLQQQIDALKGEVEELRQGK